MTNPGVVDEKPKGDQVTPRNTKNKAGKFGTDSTDSKSLAQKGNNNDTEDEQDLDDQIDYIGLFKSPEVTSPIIILIRNV